MISFLAEHGQLVADTIKSKVQFRICYDLGPNAKLRVFPGIEHVEWYTNKRVLDCILREADAKYCPAWRRAQADVSRGVGLSQLIARSLESELNLSLEEDAH